MINVLVVDDQNLTHRLIETYLKSEPNIKIIGFASDGQQAIEQVSRQKPDIVLMDVEMPRMNGLAATKIINRRFPETKVLILTVHDNEKHLSTALKNGAKGYLLKTITPHELINSIQYAHQGYFQLSIELTEKYLQKIIITESDGEDISEVKRKVNYLYKMLSKLEDKLAEKLEKNLEDGLGEQIEYKFEGMLQKEMAILRDRDSHLQFKVDRMKYTQERLQQGINYLLKVQVACIATVLLTIFYLVFARLS